MTRQCLLSVVLAGALGLCPSLLVASELLSEPEVAQHGMTRPWCTQAQVDPVSGRVTDVVFDDGTLFVLTDQAVLQAIDAFNRTHALVAAGGAAGDAVRYTRRE